MAAIITDRPKKVRIGDLLVANRVISEEQLGAALAEQKTSGRKLGRILIENGYVTEAALLELLAKQLNIPHVDLKRFPFNPEVVRALPESHARRFRAIVLERSDESLMVGMADPTDIFAYDELARTLRRPIRLAVVAESQLLKTIDMVYRRTDQISGLAAELEQELVGSAGVDLAQLADASGLTDAPVVKLLQSVFEDAVQVGASDIHIEPDEREVRIRFRIDGVLRVQTTADRRIAGALVSRLKLMSGLDISEKRIPQDGRTHIRVRERTVDVRISTMPVQYGESVVMRILNQSGGEMGLAGTGMSDEMLVRFRKLIQAPNGMVLVTGPTGSGKTTTLYGALAELNKPESKLMTVEDPVEYRLAGVNQVQVNTRIDLSFSRVLRSMLRQDPDVVLVGEMRDQETAEIGLRAAMTGHLVLSSLHTNDAISTAARLVDMGAPVYLVAAALRGILAQRLVRRVCESCAAPLNLDPGTQALLKAEFGGEIDDMKFKRGAGCSHCNGTGYSGRIGIFELLEMDGDLISALQSADPRQFAEAARSQPGFVSLRRAAMRLAADGVTTIDQVMRATFGVEEH